MRSLFKTGLTLTCLLWSFSAQSQDVYGLLGFRSTNMEHDGSGVSVYGQQSLQAGVLVNMEGSGQIRLVAGALYTERNVEISRPGQVKSQLGLSYLDIPVMAGYAANEVALLYTGPFVSMKLADRVRGDQFDLDGASGSLFGWKLGAVLRITPLLVMDVYVDRAFGAVWSEDSGDRGFEATGVGVNLGALFF